MLNILTEAVIRLQTSPGSQQTSFMPEVYAALMADEVEAFPRLRQLPLRSPRMGSRRSCQNILRTRSASSTTVHVLD